MSAQLKAGLTAGHIAELLNEKCGKGWRANMGAVEWLAQRLASPAVTTSASECCGVEMAPDARFCPRCGWEARAMSDIVTTPLGRFRATTTGWLWECRCGTWCKLSDDQMAGRVSVDHHSHGTGCDYHELHDFAAALEAARPGGGTPTL